MARQAKLNRKSAPITTRQTETAAVPLTRHPETEMRRTATIEIMKGPTMNAKMKNTMDEIATRSAEFAQKGYDQMLGSTREQLEKASVNAFKTYEEMSKFQKDNYEAYMAASTIFAQGVEHISKAWVAFTQQNMENAAQTAKALLGAKTLREAVDVQSDWAKTSFDKFVAEGTKLSELSVKVANEAYAPINARFNVAVEKMLKPVAA
jgi:phasin family protein